PRDQPPKAPEPVNPFVPPVIPENQPASPAARTAETAEPTAGSDWWETGMQHGPAAPEPRDQPPKAPEPVNPFVPPAIPENQPASPAAERTEKSATEDAPAGDREPDREISAPLAGVSAETEAPPEGVPVDIIRTIVANICPGDLLLVETGEISLPEWTHTVMTAARDDLDRRAAEGISIDASEFLRLAIVENVTGFHEEAEAHLKEALPRSDRLGLVLNALAVVSLAREKIGPAIAYGREAIQETGGDDSVAAAVLSNLGDFYRLQGHEAQAAEAYETAIASLGPQGDYRWASRLHLRAGRLHLRMDQADKARLHLSDSVRLFKAAHDDSGHVQALAELGSVLTELGSHDLAIRNLEEGIRICLRTGDRPGSALVQQVIGVAYMAQDQLTRALAYFESALSLHRQLGDRTGEADTLSHMGRIYDSRGDVEEARRLQQAAAEINRELGREL
ncbi:MAG: tetratricopeptide repeat protein, partial [Deltaproteobacteria bacterium]|nr:tetratricopeptide repeat protein [Deltaproteobacteria bacterium]